jgi:hypothetical protein
MNTFTVYMDLFTGLVNNRLCICRAEIWQRIWGVYNDMEQTQVIKWFSTPQYEICN